MDFISDRHNRKIREILRKHNFSIRFISKPARYLKQCFKKTVCTKSSSHNCEVCKRLPLKYKCTDRFLIYKFTCNSCKDFYIGETCRTFNLRYSEHKRSLERQDGKSALSHHVKTAHSDKRMKIDDFCVNVLA